MTATKHSAALKLHSDGLWPAARRLKAVPGLCEWPGCYMRPCSNHVQVRTGGLLALSNDGFFCLNAIGKSVGIKPPLQKYQRHGGSWGWCLSGEISTISQQRRGHRFVEIFKLWIKINWPKILWNSLIKQFRNVNWSFHI